MMTVAMRVILAMLLAAAPALAQQPPAGPLPPEIQALQARVWTEVNGNLQCVANTVTLQQELAALRAKIAELEKAAPSAPPSPLTRHPGG